MKNIKLIFNYIDGGEYEREYIGAELAIREIASTFTEYAHRPVNVHHVEIHVDGECFADDVTDADEAKEILSDCYLETTKASELLDLISGGVWFTKNKKLAQIIAFESVLGMSVHGATANHGRKEYTICTTDRRNSFGIKQNAKMEWQATK